MQDDRDLIKDIQCSCRIQSWPLLPQNLMPSLKPWRLKFMKCDVTPPTKLQPTRYNISWCIYFYRCCTCFRQFLLPSSGAHNCMYSFTYCQPILLLTGIMDEMELFHLIHDSSKQQYWLTVPEAVRTVTCSWWWVEELPQTCGVSVEINKSRNVASCWL